MAANASNKQGDQVSVTVLVDKQQKKVLLAEAGKDFVDVLFSFLTLPLGTIARLVAKDSNIEAVRFGSISSLYQSVTNLDEQYLWSHTCKEMLINPRNSMEHYCRKMKLNIDETELLLYLCDDKTCQSENGYYVSFFRDQKCICGKLLNLVCPQNFNSKNGFVKETSTFIISDNIFVMPNLLGSSLNLLQKMGVNDINAIDIQRVNISKKEVIDLLKLSLLSKTPLTDFIFNKEKFLGNLDPRNLMEFRIGEVEEPSYKIVVKVLRRKSNAQILFIEAGEDFADFVFSFLTLPLGRVLPMLGRFSFVSCIDNLYKSVTELSPDRCLRSQNIKNVVLTKPSICMPSELKNQILPVGMAPKLSSGLLKFVDPKSPISGGFTRGSTSFMVTDDLVVSPTSSISGVSYFQRMKVPLNDVEERVITH